MAKKEWRTSPDHENEGWPKGVPYIIGNEGCERFSYYGMKSILTIHFISLFALAGYVANEAESLAIEGMHTFSAAVYFFPLIGGIVSDRLLGKYRTTLWLSILYCFGHAVLSFGDFGASDPQIKLNLMYLGLAMIAVGSGGIKPVVSANVGDQFGKKNWHLVRTMFQAFYFIVNFGSFFATLLIPFLKDEFGAGVAFAIPGILMAIATLIFWLGRHKFVHVPPTPGKKLGLLDVVSALFLLTPLGLFFFLPSANWLGIKGIISAIGFVVGLVVFFYRQSLQQDDGFLAILLFALKDLFQGGDKKLVKHADTVPSNHEEKILELHWLWKHAVNRFGFELTDGPRSVIRVFSIFIMVSVFWGLFEQHSSTWIVQAELLDRNIDLPFLGQMTLKASQIPALNPLMVMLLIPLTNVIYKMLEKVGIRTTPLRRMSAGMVIAGIAYISVSLIQEEIELLGPNQVSIWWQVVSYWLITISEVLISITGLEFAYTQAPARMKSTMMSVWKLVVSLGNKMVVVVIHDFTFEHTSDKFWFFTKAMFIASALFMIRAYLYKGKEYTQK